jgi:transposase
VSRKLVNRFDVIAFEDLSIARMLKNHCLAKSIADAAWNQLIGYTTYKAEEAGRSLYWLTHAEHQGAVRPVEQWSRKSCVFVFTTVLLCG